MKPAIILLIVKIVMGAIALGLGIWYVSSSIGGASLGYASMPAFMTAIGVENGDIASANGCFFCGYIEQLFAVIGSAAEMFWTGILDTLWVLMAVGFAIFLFVHTANYLLDASKKNADLGPDERKLELKPWFDKVWKQFARILFVGALLGVVGMGGTGVLRGVTNVVVTPVMLVGAELSMAATGISNSAQCAPGTSDDILNPVMRPFMCVMGNLNAVMLAGASGGFALMNYAWMDEFGGGAITWIAGLALVIMFLVIGFNLFFDVLSVVFKLIFLIIFAPLLLAAAAFSETWGLAKGVIGNAIKMLVTSAVRIVAITLKILIIYAIVSYAADEHFPGPGDGYTSILPPLLQESSSQSPVAKVFSTCEQTAMTDDGIDRQTFRDCFGAQRATVERTHPGAFDFMDNGWEFLMLMMGLFLLYYYAMDKRIDAMLAGGGNAEFDFGNWIKDMGKRVWGIPEQITGTLAKGKK